MSAFQLVRPTIFILCVSLFSSLSSFAFPPPTLPSGYYDRAFLGYSANVDKVLETYESAFWKLEIDPQLSGCNISFGAFITVSGSTEAGSFEHPPVFLIPRELFTNDFTILAGTIKDAVGITNTAGHFWVSHLSFRLYVNGQQTGVDIFPQSGWQTISLGNAQAPCNCISVYFDKVNNKISVIPGVGC